MTKQLFRVEFFVEDRHLANTMRSLAGIAIEPKFVPVVNAELTTEERVNAKMKGLAKSLKVKASVPGGMLNLIVSRLKGMDSFNKADVMAILKKEGRRPASAGYYVKDMLKHGLSHKVPGTTGKHTRYTAKAVK